MRSEVIRADIDRIEAMSDDEFRDRWGTWARAQDRDPTLVRQRWLDDLRRALPYAEREEAAVAELVAAKDAYRADPSGENRARKVAAVEAVRAIRAEERTDAVRIGGDAFVTGG